MKYEKMIQSILKEVGGQENIESVSLRNKTAFSAER